MFTTNSTRRFFSRPSALSDPSEFWFGAIGWLFPKPWDDEVVREHAMIDERGANRIGAAFAQSLIVAIRSLAVGVAFDDNSLRSILSPRSLLVSSRGE